MSSTHAERKHARLSASRIQRAILCPGSVQAEEAMPDEPAGQAAERGTSIHELSEALLLGNPVPDDHDPEHLEISRGYVKAIAENIPNAKKRHIELNLTSVLTTIHPELGGTADLVTIGGGELTVVDLKTGRVPVSPNTAQLWTYALGAVLHFNPPPAVRVRLAIYQPEAGGWKDETFSQEDILDWRHTLKKTADGAFSDNPPRSASSEACRYCRAKPVCPALRDSAVAATRQEFTFNKHNVIESTRVTPELLDQAEMCVMWGESVQTAAKAQIIASPGSVPGWRLRDGRKMVTWKDRSMAEELLATNRQAWELKSASAVQKMGLDLPAGLIEESRAAASLVRDTERKSFATAFDDMPNELSDEQMGAKRANPLDRKRRADVAKTLSQLKTLST